MAVGRIEVQDESSYGAAETLSIKEIILRQIRKIADISCKEFTGGYWEKKPIKTGNGMMFSETYHEDVRESYCNSVDFLIDIIYPLSDEDLKDYLKKFEGFKEKIVKYNLKNNTKEVEDIKEDPDIKIAKKIKLKRQTFRQINLMFERNNFWQGSGGYNE